MNRAVLTIYNKCLAPLYELTSFSTILKLCSRKLTSFFLYWDEVLYPKRPNLWCIFAFASTSVIEIPFKTSKDVPPAFGCVSLDFLGDFLHRRPKLSIRLPLNVTLAYERCCVTKIRFIRFCMENNGFALKVKKYVYFVNKVDLLWFVVSFFVVCQILRSIQRVFGELSLFRCPLLK